MSIPSSTMKKHSLSGAILFLLIVSFARAVPTPITEPKHTYDEAVKLVMKVFTEASKDYLPRWRDQAFPQSIVYTSFKHSLELQQALPETVRNDFKKSGKAWLFSETGWLITVVMARDLSQSITYFVRPNGDVELLWETD